VELKLVVNGGREEKPIWGGDGGTSCYGGAFTEGRDPGLGGGKKKKTAGSSLQKKKRKQRKGRIREKRERAASVTKTTYSRMRPPHKKIQFLRRTLTPRSEKKGTGKTY